MLRRLAPLVVALACWTGHLSAQTLPPAPQSTPDAIGEEKPERNVVLPAAVAVGLSLLVLLVVCVPSRKA